MVFVVFFAADFLRPAVLFFTLRLAPAFLGAAFLATLLFTTLFFATVFFAAVFMQEGEQQRFLW